MKILSDTLRKREMAIVLDERSLPASKTEVSWENERLYSTLCSYLVPIAPMAASKIALGHNSLL